MKEPKKFGKMVATVAALCASMAMADGVKTARWTGGGVRSNVNDPRNWAVTDSQGATVENAVPDAETKIVISGKTDFNCPLGQTLTYNSITISNCTLTADCDWRGLTVLPSPSYIDIPKGAYIDTGFKPNNNTRVVLDVTVQGSKESLFGVSDENSDHWYHRKVFSVANDGGGVFSGFGNEGGTGNSNDGRSVLGNDRHTVDFNKGALYLDGGKEEDGIKVPNYTHTASTFQLSNNLYLFADNKAGIKALIKDAGHRFHSCRIYDNGELVRDYVPTNNGTAFGLYDRKNGTFSGTSDASLPFTGETATVEINGTVDLSGFSLAIADTAGSGTITDTAGYLDIPKGYYLDTGFKPSNNTRVVMDLYTVKEGGETWFGVSDDSTTKYWQKRAFGVSSDSDSVYSGFGNDGGNWGGKVTIGRYTIDFDKGTTYLYRDGSFVEKKERTAENFQLNNKLYLFAHNKNGNNSPDIKAGSHRFHSCKIYNGEDLVHDYIPAKRKTEYGIYDKVASEFKSLSGSGSGNPTGDVAKGTLRIDVCAGRTVENSTLTITGTLKLVKDGEGTLVSKKEKQSYTGGTFVDNGLAKCNKDVGNTPWGPSKSLITVEDGAAFDYAGVCTGSSTPYSFSIKGAGADGKGALLNSAGSGDTGGFWRQNIIADLELRGDATIRGCASFGFSLGGNENYTSTYTHKLGLNGYTLSIFLNSNSSDRDDSHHIFAFRGVQASGGGTIIMRNESSSKVTFPSFYSAPSDLSGVTFDLGEGMGINVEAVPTVGTFIDRRTTVGREDSNNINKSITVLDTYKPMTAGLLKTVTLGDSTHHSPVLDLSGIGEPFDLTAADPDRTIGAAQDAVVKVKLGDRKTSGSTPIITWEGTRPDWVDVLRFARGDENRKYGLRVGDDGIYAVAGLIILFR